MAFFEGKEMTGGYGGPDIITSCTINVDQGEIVAILEIGRASCRERV